MSIEASLAQNKIGLGRQYRPALPSTMHFYGITHQRSFLVLGILLPHLHNDYKKTNKESTYTISQR